MSDEGRSVGATYRAFCSSCGGIRNCEIKGFHHETGGEHEYQWSTEWFLLTCRGCEHVFAQSVSTDSESYYYDEYGERDYEQKIRSWPARSNRKRPDWFEHSYLDTHLEDTNDLVYSLSELYGALNEELLLLSAIGIRTSFDIAAEILGVEPSKSFAEKLKELVEKSHILESTQDRLAVLVDAGSASAHRGWRPSLPELNTLMDILEEFIFNAMILPKRKVLEAQKLEALKNRVPQRKAKGKLITSAASTLTPAPGI